MLISTTPSIEGKRIVEYFGLVSGVAISQNDFRRWHPDYGDRGPHGRGNDDYWEGLRRARDTAIEEMVEQAKALGANAVVGVDLDYETITIGQGGNMLMVSASGTAVACEE